MHQARRVGTYLAAAALASSLSCGSDMNGPESSSGGNHCPCPFTNIPAPPGGVAQFTVMPVAIAPGMSLTALGSLNPPGHVLPTDHVYFYDGDLSKNQPFGSDTRDVFMPATGAVISLLPNAQGETKVMFRATPAFYFYFDHVVLTQPLTIGQIVQVGTKLGNTTKGTTLDLGAFDTTATHSGFVNRARYGEQTLYYVSPWQYFTPELQAQLYPHVYRTAAASDKDGQLDFGISGKLAGDWFVSDMPADSSWEPYGWTRTISFAYDYYDPSQVRVSIGGTVGPAGVWAIDSAAPRPERVTAGSGVVPYLLYSPFDKGFPPYGLLLVRMNDDTTISVELFVGERTVNRQMDAGASTFVR
ncbi:MAG TPA: hypothetical protein VN706_01615 [Gemmatimonadaceae bacterium]|nr:hypothetical protein [Gemmatimonadaceae bacterium]